MLVCFLMFIRVDVDARSTRRDLEAVERNGDVFRISSCTGSNHNAHSIASLSEGGFVAVWVCANSVFAQVFSAHREPAFSEVIVYRFPHTTNTTFVTAAHVTPIQKGDSTKGAFTVLWEQIATNQGLHGRVFTLSGEPVGETLLISTEANHSRRELACATSLDAAVVTTWVGENGTTIYGRIHRYTGQVWVASPIEVLLMAEGGRAVHSHSVARLSRSGDVLVVVWSESEWEGPTASVVKKVVITVSEQFFVATAVEVIGSGDNEEHTFPQVYAADHEGYAVAWEVQSIPLGRAVQFYLKDEDNVVQQHTIVDKKGHLMWFPNIHLLEEGVWVVAWNQLQWSPATLNALPTISGRLFHGNGGMAGEVFQLPLETSLETASSHGPPGLASLGGNRFVVTWQREQDSVHGQELQPSLISDTARWSPYVFVGLLATVALILFLLSIALTTRYGGDRWRRATMKKKAMVLPDNDDGEDEEAYAEELASIPRESEAMDPPRGGVLKKGRTSGRGEGGSRDDACTGSAEGAKGEEGPKEGPPEDVQVKRTSSILSLDQIGTEHTDSQ